MVNKLCNSSGFHKAKKANKHSLKKLNNQNGKHNDKVLHFKVTNFIHKL